MQGCNYFSWTWKHARTVEAAKAATIAGMACGEVSPSSADTQATSSGARSEAPHARKQSTAVAVYQPRTSALAAASGHTAAPRGGRRPIPPSQHAAAAFMRSRRPDQQLRSSTNLHASKEEAPAVPRLQLPQLPNRQPRSCGIAPCRSIGSLLHRPAGAMHHVPRPPKIPSPKAAAKRLYICEEAEEVPVGQETDDEEEEELQDFIDDGPVQKCLRYDGHENVVLDCSKRGVLLNSDSEAE